MKDKELEMEKPESSGTSEPLTKEHIKSRVIHIISSTTGISDSELTEESELVEKGIDSLEIVEIVMVIEDEFGIEIPQEKASEFKRISTLLQYLYETLKV